MSMCEHEWVCKHCEQNLKWNDLSEWDSKPMKNGKSFTHYYYRIPLKWIDSHV